MKEFKKRKNQDSQKGFKITFIPSLISPSKAFEVKLLDQPSFSCPKLKIIIAIKIDKS